MNDLLFFIRYLWRYLRLRLVLWVILIAAAALLEGLSVGLIFPVLEGADSGGAFTDFITGLFDLVGLTYSLGLALGFMAGFFVLRTGFLIYQELFAQRIITTLLVKLKVDLLSGLYRVDYPYLARHNQGYLTNAVAQEYTRVAAAFEQVMRLVVGVGFAIVYGLLPLLIDVSATVVFVLLAAPGYLVLRRVFAITRQLSLRRAANNAEIQSRVVQLLQHFKYLRATHSGTNVLSRLYRTIEEQGSLYYKEAIVKTVTSRGSELVMFGIVISILYYYVVILEFTLVAMLFLIFLIRRAILFVFTVQDNFRGFVGSAGSIRVFRTLEAEISENAEVLNHDGAEPDFSEAISFDHVSFSYDSGNPVLKDISFSISPRQTLAIVGPSGSGKSTLATLITGLVKPSAGVISLGRTPYQDLDQMGLRSKIGYVTQESVIFTDTIENNVTLFSADAEDSLVASAISRAHLHDFIAALPDGLDSPLSDSGLNVSGGQRQRINIARELFKDVRLLIFDEATSSLDTDSEREVQANIDDFRGDKTVVIIAHRLSTVRNSDNVLLLGHGEIIEQGSYQELYGRGGAFRRMVDQQALGEPDGSTESGLQGT